MESIENAHSQCASFVIQTAVAKPPGQRKEGLYPCAADSAGRHPTYCTLMMKSAWDSAYREDGSEEDSMCMQSAHEELSCINGKVDLPKVETSTCGRRLKLASVVMVPRCSLNKLLHIAGMVQAPDAL
jgi:hypothetical protein